MSKPSIKISFILFFAALAIRVVAILAWESEQSLLYVSDSLTYLQTAKNLLEHGVYSMALFDPPIPDNFRTPLYPLFLIPFAALNLSLYMPVIAQSILVSISIVISYHIARKLFSEKIAFWAMLALALEPFTALVGTQIMTESLFMSLFLPGVLLLALYVKQQTFRHLLIGSALLALSALTRPVAFYLFPLIPLSCVIPVYKKINLPQTLSVILKQTWLAIQSGWRNGVIGLVIFLAILSPWLLFVRLAVGNWSMDSLSQFDLYAYHGVYFDEWRAKRGAIDRLPKLDLTPLNSTFDAREISPLAAAGRAYIKDHASEYARYHFFRLPALYTDSGYAIIFAGMPFLDVSFEGGDEIDSAEGGLLDHVIIGQFKKTAALISKKPIAGILFLADLAFFIMALLAFGSLFIHKYKRGIFDNVLLFFLCLLIGYTILASPIGGARLRIPLNPFLFLLATHAILLLKTQRKSDTIGSKAEG